MTIQIQSLPLRFWSSNPIPCLSWYFVSNVRCIGAAAAHSHDWWKAERQVLAAKILWSFSPRSAAQGRTRSLIDPLFKKINKIWYKVVIASKFVQYDTKSLSLNTLSSLKLRFVMNFDQIKYSTWVLFLYIWVSSPNQFDISVYWLNPQAKTSHRRPPPPFN